MLTGHADMPGLGRHHGYDQASTDVHDPSNGYIDN